VDKKGQPTMTLHFALT